jgi:ketosteroid isomerase-like protein
MAEENMASGDVKLNDNAFALFTGSEQDRKDVIAIHRAYLDANTNDLNEQDLRAIWSSNPNCVFFNGTGYNYYGIEDWLKLWAYFRTRVKIIEPWTSFDVRLIGDDRIAVVTSGRVAKGQWIGSGPAPEWTMKQWRSRSTEVFRKEKGAWKCVHIHISTEAEGPRHEQRG